MKNRLNNKGFAVSTVVYAILILLVILMFTILLLYRNTYRNQKQFNADVQDELNDYLIEQTPPDTNPPTCTLKSTKNADGSYTLTITSTSTDLDYVNGAYMFEGENYSNEINKVVKKSDCAGGTCTYKAYVRDTAVPSNVSVACETTVKFDITAPTCTLEYDGTNLVITSTDTDLADKPYSFDGTNYDSSKTKPTSTTGSYTGYVKDTSENVGRCYATLSKFTATFSLENDYSSQITSPTSQVSESCFTTGTSCNVTTPNLTVSSTSSYTYTAKGWSTSKDLSMGLVGSATSISLSNDITYYPLITRSSNSSGGSSGGSSCGCNIGSITTIGSCVNGKRSVKECVSTGQICGTDYWGTKYKGKYVTTYEDC